MRASRAPRRRCLARWHSATSGAHAPSGALRARQPVSAQTALFHPIPWKSQGLGFFRAATSLFVPLRSLPRWRHRAALRLDRSLLATFVARERWLTRSAKITCARVAPSLRQPAVCGCSQQLPREWVTFAPARNPKGVNTPSRAFVLSSGNKNSFACLSPLPRAGSCSQRLCPLSPVVAKAPPLLPFSSTPLSPPAPLPPRGRCACPPFARFARCPGAAAHFMLIFSESEEGAEVK